MYLLVDDHKALVIFSADLVLQFNNFAHTLLNELPFSHHQLLSFIRALVKEARIHLTVETASLLYNPHY